MEKLTIAEALRELKRIDSLFIQRCQNIKRYCSKKKNSPDEITNQKTYIKEQVQSANDLLTRYKNIKLEINKANLVASFPFKNKTYTIAEALLYKQYLKNKYDLLYDSFTTENANRQLSVIRMNVQLAPEELEAANLVPEVYYDEKKIQTLKEDLLELMSIMDALIDQTNHKTTIKI